MYAIVKDRGQDYTMSPGEVIELEKFEAKAGSEIVFSDVMYYKTDKDEIFVGTPFVSGVKVKGIVEGDFKGPKVIAFKYRRKKASWNKKGHRHIYTKVRIKSIVKE